MAGRAVGHLRLDQDGDATLVSVLIDPAYRGQGMALRALAAAESEARRLGLRGLRTLAVRLRQHSATALRLTTWLKSRPEVDRVLYPPLPSDPGHALWKRDFSGACGLFGVILKPLLSSPGRMTGTPPAIFTCSG